MDIHFIRQELRTKTIYDIPLRVTFYARVSTESEEQINSLDNQISYYQDMIQKNTKWTYVDGYIDEGLSAATVTKRKHFHHMIEDAKNGKFDYILTKEITRFARNTLDSIQYTRKLLSYGVAVFFQNDNINTLDEDSELRLTSMSGLAHDEVPKLTSRNKCGHQQAIKNNVVLGNSRIFGYQKDTKRLVIDEDEAIMVRELFELYATNQYSMKQIEDIFWNKGYRNHNGNKISHTTMSGIISNPKYKGYYVGNKVKVVDMFTKKQKFLPPEEWVMFKDETGEIVPAIVSENLWDMANAVLIERSQDVKKRQNLCNHKNLLTGKLFCTQCGTPYYRRDSKDKTGAVNSRWVCSGKIKNGADSCNSFAIYESEIIPILFEMFRASSENIDGLIEHYVEIYKNVNRGEHLTEEIEALRKKVMLEEKKKSKLLEYNVSGSLSDRDFLTMNQQCTNEIIEAESKIEELEAQLESRAGFQQHIAQVRKVLTQAASDAQNGIINTAFVSQYIDKIFVTPQEDGMRLEIKIFTGESTERFLENLRSRSGHTFFLIFPILSLLLRFCKIDCRA